MRFNPIASFGTESICTLFFVLAFSHSNCYVAPFRKMGRDQDPFAERLTTCKFLGPAVKDSHASITFHKVQALSFFHGFILSVSTSSAAHSQNTTNVLCKPRI